MFKNNKISAKVDIVIGTLSCIKQKNRTVFIKWTRGKHSDKTQNSLLDKYGCTTFNQEFSVPCTLFVDKKTKKIKRKKISFSIILEKENNKKLSSKLKGGSRKEIKIGKIEIDVTKRFEYGSTKNKPLVLEYPLNLKNRTSHLRVPTLTIASRIDLNGNKKRNKKKKKNQSKEQKEKEKLPLLKSTHVLRKFEEFEMLNRKTLKPVSETEDYTEITAKTEFRTDSEEEEKRIKRRQRKDFYNQNNNDEDFKESSQDFSSYNSTEENSGNEEKEKEKEFHGLSNDSNEEKEDSPIYNEKPNNQNENLTFKQTLKKTDHDQENERKKEENDNDKGNGNDRHLDLKNDKPYKNSVSGWNKTRVRKKNSMFELDEEEKELIESFSKKRKEQLKKKKEEQEREKEEEEEGEEEEGKKKEKKSSSLRISHDHSVDQKDNKRKKSSLSNQEKNTNKDKDKNNDSSDLSEDRTTSNISGSDTESNSSFSSENESNHGLGLGMFLDNTPDKKKKQEEEEEEEEEETDQLNEQEQEEQKEKEEKEKEEKEKEKKEKEKREKEKREKEKREKEKKEKEKKEKEKKEKEKREKEKREKEKKEKEKKEKEKEEEKDKKNKSTNQKKKNLKYPKTQQKKPHKQNNNNQYNKRSKSDDLISPRPSPSTLKKKKNLRKHKNKKFTPKKQSLNKNQRNTSHKNQRPSNFESKKKKNNTNNSNRSKTPTESFDNETNPKTNSKDQIISEQKNVLKNRDEEIENLKKSLQYSKLIKLENWLIERILFFSESIYSNGYPLPSCVLMKCFLNWDAFQPNPLILNSNFQLSQIQTENFLSVYLNSINLLIQVNRNKTENLYWLLSNLVFMIKLINEIFPTELGKAIKLKRELKAFKKSAAKNNGLTEEYHKQIIIKKEQKQLKILKFKKQVNLEITNIFQLIFTNVFKSIKPYLIKTFLIYQKSSFSRKSTRKNKKKGKEKKDPSLQIKKILENLIQSIRNNNLPKEFIQIFFKQIVYAIDVTLINELLRQKKYCTCGNGFQIKLKITQFEELLNKFRFNKKKVDLKLFRIKQASQCLAMNKVLVENSNENYKACSDIAPDLNLIQVQQLLVNLSIDEFDPQIITEQQYKKLDDFINNYKMNYRKKNNSNTNSNFNLEFDITYFFNVEINYHKINILNWDNVPVPIILKSKEEFYFLKKSLDEILKNKK
ncbi:histone-lysine n-methyltransferase ash1 [Anaeramoeba flamelloides]|uniref:Histone-lysine n-methyltransferase ash1 n=1 Tax=Anaeramoeba flamelloides TaxID=1746091 RepID=A0AAV7ZGW3_9EUKA|nr:histone-lysine n-methyltransferase ash1 [Anaeramoeba flamelloides]